MTVENVTAKAFAIFEGSEAVTIKGGSYGGYNIPSFEEDSAIGVTGPASCNGSSPPARNIVLDGVHMHDSYWPVHSREDFGTSHPDCFQIIGNVDGLTIRNSLFERCGDSFIGAFPDQGDFTNVVIEHNTFRQLGGFTYFGMQISGQGPSVSLLERHDPRQLLLAGQSHQPVAQLRHPARVPEQHHHGKRLPAGSGQGLL